MSNPSADRKAISPSHPGLIAVGAFVDQNPVWQRRTYGLGVIAFGRTFVFSDASTLQQFTAELLFRKHRSNVPGELVVNNASLDLTLRALEPDETGGTQIALAESLDMLFASMMKLHGS